MSEERKLILQMVAEGKITPEEAEKLLQAIDETEKAAETAATENVHTERRGEAPLPSLGESIERAVKDSLKGLDDSLRHLEIHLDHKFGEHRRHEFDQRVEERMRRAAERAVHRASRAEERAREAAERAAQKAAEKAEKMARKFDTHFEHMRHEVHRPHFVKVGVAIDKVTVNTSKELSLPAMSGDRLILENRVGDVRVEFYDGTEIQVDANLIVWGEDEKDAGDRAEATKVALTRRAADVVLELVPPEISAVGVLMLKDTRVDYTIRVPHGTHLQVSAKVGDVTVVAGDKVGQWQLSSKVGDVDIQVGRNAGFRYDLDARLGDVKVGISSFTEGKSGTVGDGSGSIQASVKTGDIRLHY